MTDVHSSTNIDVEITDTINVVDTADLQKKIDDSNGLKIDKDYRKSLANAVDGNLVKGLDPTQTGELKVALRDPEWASTPTGSVNLPSPTPALQTGALTPLLAADTLTWCC